jgi:hypothetical protein
MFLRNFLNLIEGRNYGKNIKINEFQKNLLNIYNFIIFDSVQNK